MFYTEMYVIETDIIEYKCCHNVEDITNTSCPEEFVKSLLNIHSYQLTGVENRLKSIYLNK